MRAPSSGGVMRAMCETSLRTRRECFESSRGFLILRIELKRVVEEHARLIGSVCGGHGAAGENRNARILGRSDGFTRRALGVGDASGFGVCETQQAAANAV